VLAVEAVFDVLVHIDLVHDLISVLLKGGGEDDYLVILGHQLDELNTTWPHEEEALLTVLDIVDQRLVQV
jgi:hypothetical protein